MSRFAIAVLIALALDALALLAGKWIWFWVVVAIFFAVFTLGIVFPQPRFFGPFICRGNKTQKRVALTFDDGPDARSTPELLDWLRAEKIPATFFGIGKNVVAAKELTARIAQEGHLLGNHTFTHSNATNLFSSARLREEMTRTQTAIKDAAGVEPKFFRPPMGLSNPRIFREAHRLEMRVIGWNARGFDTVCHDPQHIVARIVRRLKPGGIILLHDGNIPAGRLMVTVKSLWATLRERGYTVVPLDELLK